VRHRNSWKAAPLRGGVMQMKNKEVQIERSAFRKKKVFEAKD